MTSEIWQFPNWQAAHAEYARIGQEFAEAEADVEMSIAVGKELYAEAFLTARTSGSPVDSCKARAQLSPDYRQWAREHADKLKRKSGLKQRLNAGDIWFRMVQTTSANIRAEKTFQ